MSADRGLPVERPSDLSRRDFLIRACGVACVAGSGLLLPGCLAYDEGITVRSAVGVSPSVATFPIGPDSRPYDMPSAPPWNAPTYAITPTPDGSGCAVHPSVVDLGPDAGRPRFWMAMTPYALGIPALENPCVLTSHDGFTWWAPSGLTNPIDPYPTPCPPPFPVVRHNSDPELVVDLAHGDLVCYWREAGRLTHPRTETLWAAASTDGASWGDPVHLITVVSPNLSRLLSPCVVRVSDGDWRMFTVDVSNPSVMRSAPGPFGPWSDGEELGFEGEPLAGPLWHLGIVHQEGLFYAILNIRETWCHQLATSADGLRWTVGPVVMTNTDGWDDRSLYRATLAPHENGEVMRVWYSSNSTSVSWRIGYTALPLSLWPV